jgi:hypothetical protein
MVTVSGYNIRTNKSGENFIALDLVGSLEIVQSQVTGNMYATVRRCSIPSTFDENIAKMMVGSQIEGDVVRVASAPYEYVNKRTGEILMLAYSYAYQPKGSKQLIGEGVVSDDIIHPNPVAEPAKSTKPKQKSGAAILAGK